MECKDVQTHLADHLAGALPASTADEVAAHLETCEACRAEFEAVEDTWHRLRAIPAAPANSAAMRARFDQALDAYELGVDQTAARGHRWSHYGLQFAAAAAVLIIGVFIGRATTSKPAADPEIASLREELHDMREMVTLSLLQQQSASERLKGVSWTNDIERPGAEVAAALLDALMHDPNDNVRLRTVDALKRFADRDSVRRGAAEALSRQPSPLVQIALIEFVVQANDREAAPALRQLAGDSMVDAAVRMRAAEGLARLGA